MIDIEFIKRKIYKPDENEYKIMPGDEIPLEVMHILKDGHYKDREECFGPGDPKVLCTVHLNCTQCDAETTAMLSKTGVLNYLRGSKQVLCNNCINKEKEEAEMVALQEQEVRKAEQENCQKRHDANTKRIIDEYVNTISTNPLSKEELIDISKNISRQNFDNNKVAAAIKSLPYKIFLQTLYWKAVSYEAKRKARFCCHVCSSNKNLSTHHRTYESHGYEHTYDGMKDLVVLCKDCHEKFHDKLTSTPQND